MMHHADEDNDVKSTAYRGMMHHADEENDVKSTAYIKLYQAKCEPVFDFNKFSSIAKESIKLRIVIELCLMRWDACNPVRLMH